MGNETGSIHWQRDDDGIVVLTFDSPGEPVNTINEPFRAELDTTVARLEAERDRITGVILASGKKTFFAGADLRALLAVRIEERDAFFRYIESFKATLRRIERLGRPVVAAIAGSALGGGLEIALACHRRIVVDDRRIEIGFPEVTLGLLPGAGGVTKFVRLMGLRAALPLLLEGRRIGPRDALAAGIVGPLVDAPEALLPAARAWIAANPAPVQPWDAPGHRIPGGSPSDPALAAMLAAAPAMLMKKTRGNYPAPQAILSAAVEGAQVDFDTALRIETRYLATLAGSPSTRALIGTMFFQLNELKSRARRGESAAPVGGVGAGVRGPYTSRVLGTYVNEGMALLGEGVPAAAIEHLGEAAGMPDGPLAVLDEMSLKLADELLHQELAELKRAAEGAEEHDHAHARRDGGHDHGHAHDHAQDHEHEHEHDHDHDHDHHDHDHAHEREHEHGHHHDHDHGHHHAHAAPTPARAKVRVKSERMAESAVYVLEKMAHGYKRHGRAAGAGFYDYPEGAPRRLWQGLRTFERGGRVIPPADDIRDRLLYAQALETVRCMDEGVVTSAADANIGSIFGWGFPAYAGGTLQFIDYVGIERFVARADELASKYGARFSPPDSLRARAGRA